MRRKSRDPIYGLAEDPEVLPRETSEGRSSHPCCRGPGRFRRQRHAISGVAARSPAKTDEVLRSPKGPKVRRGTERKSEFSDLSPLVCFCGRHFFGGRVFP
ncbi:unnamed protein product [Calypogeia fissa]